MVARSKGSAATKQAVQNETVEVVQDARVAGSPKVELPTDAAMREQGLGSLSARIRHLKSLGATTAEITKVVKRENGEHPLYQHVRNVLNTPLKKGVPEGQANDVEGQTQAQSPEASGATE
jgi:hypothetical protein